MTFFDFTTILRRCNAGCRSSKPRGGHITPRRGVYIARRLLLRSPLPFPRADALLHVAYRLRRRSNPPRRPPRIGPERKILRDHGMDALGLTESPRLACLTPDALFASYAPWGQRVGLAAGFSRVEVRPDGCLRKTLEFYRGVFAQSVEAAGYAF